MNRMADGVLKDMDEMQKKEDLMIARYEKERDVKERLAIEAKAKRRREEQKEINRTLSHQLEEKMKRKKEDKQNFDE